MGINTQDALKKRADRENQAAERMKRNFWGILHPPGPKIEGLVWNGPIEETEELKNNKKRQKVLSDIAKSKAEAVEKKANEKARAEIEKAERAKKTEARRQAWFDRIAKAKAAKAA